MYLVLSALTVIGFPTPELFKFYKDSGRLSGLTKQVKVLQQTKDPELHLAAPKQWRMPTASRWSRIQRLTSRSQVKFQPSLHQLWQSKSDLRTWCWLEVCPSRTLTCWHHPSARTMEVWLAAVALSLTAALGNHPWSACLPLPLSGMR